MKLIAEYKGEQLYQDESGELWELYEGEKSACFSSIEQWKYDIDFDEEFRADAHSCYNNAVLVSNGPAGPGEYCTECGALVKSFDY